MLHLSRELSLFVHVFFYCIVLSIVASKGFKRIYVIICKQAEFWCKINGKTWLEVVIVIDFHSKLLELDWDDVYRSDDIILRFQAYISLLNW